MAFTVAVYSELTSMLPMPPDPPCPLPNPWSRIIISAMPNDGRFSVWLSASAATVVLVSVVTVSVSAANAVIANPPNMAAHAVSSTSVSAIVFVSIFLPPPFLF